MTPQLVTPSLVSDMPQLVSASASDNSGPTLITGPEESQSNGNGPVVSRTPGRPATPFYSELAGGFGGMGDMMGGMGGMPDFYDYYGYQGAGASMGGMGMGGGGGGMGGLPLEAIMAQMQGMGGGGGGGGMMMMMPGGGMGGRGSPPGSNPHNTDTHTCTRAQAR